MRSEVCLVMRLAKEMIRPAPLRLPLPSVNFSLLPRPLGGCELLVSPSASVRGEVPGSCLSPGGSSLPGISAHSGSGRGSRSAVPPAPGKDSASSPATSLKSMGAVTPLLLSPAGSGVYCAPVPTASSSVHLPAAPRTEGTGRGGPRPGSRSLDSDWGRDGSPPMALPTCSVAARECRPPVDSVPEDQRAECVPSPSSPTGGIAWIAGHSVAPVSPPRPPLSQTAAGDDASVGEESFSLGLIEGGKALLAPSEEPFDPAAVDDVGLSARGASALQPVASVSTDAIALRWFWLRFVNEEIEAM